MSFMQFWKLRNLGVYSLLVCTAIAGGIYLRSGTVAQTNQAQQREELYRLNNLGVAYMEQYKHEEAAAEFKKALAQDPNFLIARVNLALAYYFQQDMKSALAEAQIALKQDPNNLQMRYLLGALYKNSRQIDDAISEYKKVAVADPDDVATNINLGQLYSQKQQYGEAISYFRKALDAEPYNATAAYSLATALIRSGDRQAGQQAMDRFQQLRASGYATTLGLLYLEQGRYGEAILSQGNEPELVSKEVPAVRFVNASSASAVSAGLIARSYTAAIGRKLSASEFSQPATKNDLVGSFGSSVGLFDYNNDGRLDIYLVNCDPQGKLSNRLLQNQADGKFADVTDRAKVGATALGMGAIFGDYNNDGYTDILVINYGSNILYRNNGDGTYTDATAGAGLDKDKHWSLTAAFVDYDHDGDLDIFVGNFVDMSKWPGGESATFPDDFVGEPNILYRNNGNGTFTDVTAQAGLSGAATRTTAIVCTDFDNRRDIDFYIVNYNQPNQLLSNRRDGTFKDVAAELGVANAGSSFAVAAGDLNKDSFTDFYLPQANGAGILYLSNGRGGFTSRTIAGAGSLSAQLIDYDNDGLLDVLEVGRDGFHIRRNLGNDFVDLSGAAGLDRLKSPGNRLLASADLDADGDPDLLSASADSTLILIKNEGGNKNGWARISLEGKTSNKSAVGAKIQLRSGSLGQKIETYSSTPAPAGVDVLFGLGYRNRVDSVRIIWPAGIVQSEIDVKANATTQIKELDRKGTSCPLLYAWNGNEYQFVTDFLGGCAIGYLVAPGVYNYPDTDEYIRVSSSQLKERDGIYSILMNNQLEEVIYFDQSKLLAVDHPVDVAIYPNERLMPGPPFPEFKIYAVKGARPPLSAVDDRGQDILPLISKVDRNYPEGFELLPFKGYAREHWITLDLGDLSKAKRVVLLLTAWIDYADSTANLAASQAGEKLIPPYLQVKNRRGEWETVIAQMGFPAGLTKTMVVDLTGKLLNATKTEVRIVTSMRIYWDQIVVDSSSGEFPVRVSEMRPMRAELRWRGFPREYSPDGKRPLLYDYRVIEQSAPWKAHIGNYTRYGDVRELLEEADDMYVITRNGDEMQIDFDGRGLPAVPAGWVRDFLVYADGFGKDMDINSARPDCLGPLPFHKMRSYPYSAGESYPMDKKRLEYLEKYNTRSVRVVGPHLQALP